MTEKLTPNQFALDYSEALKRNKESAWRIGRHYVFDNKPALALRWFRIAAIQGKLEAMDDFYSNLESIRSIDDLDKLEAELWLDKACNKKFKPAIDSREAHKKYGNAWDKETKKMPGMNGT